MFFNVVKTNAKRKDWKNQKKKTCCLIPENIGLRVLSMCKNKILTEY